MQSLYLMNKMNLIFSQVIAILSDTDICQYLYDCEEIQGNIYQKSGAHITNSNGSFYITGNVFQVEWVWNYLAENIRVKKTESSDAEVGAKQIRQSNAEFVDSKASCIANNEALNRISGSSYDRYSSEGTSLGSVDDTQSAELPGEYDVSGENVNIDLTSDERTSLKVTDIQQKPIDDVNSTNNAIKTTCTSSAREQVASVDGQNFKARENIALDLQHKKYSSSSAEKTPSNVNSHDGIALDIISHIPEMKYEINSPPETIHDQALGALQDLDDIRFSLPSLNGSSESNTLDHSEEISGDGEVFDFIELESSRKRSDSFDATEERSTRKLHLFIDVLDISEAETDSLAIVSDWKLNQKTTAVGKIIAKKAGPQYHKDCKELMKNRKQKPFDCFELVPTSAGGKLSDKIRFIIHTFLPIWTSKSAENLTQELINVYFKIFSMADQLEAKSITLPLMGTGNPNFPLNVSLASLKEGIGLFQNSQHNTCLNEIHIVNIHEREVETMRRLFLKECKVDGGNVLSSNLAEQWPGSYRPVTFIMKPMKKVSQAQGCYVDATNHGIIKVSDTLGIKIYTANVTTVDVKAIAMITDKDLNHIGNLSRIISAKCGEKFQKDCQKYVLKNGPMSFGNIVHVPVDNPSLSVKNIVMTCLEKWKNKEDEDENKRQLLLAYCNTLIYADTKLEMESIAMSLFGTGEIGIDPTTSTAALFKALNMFSKYRKGTHVLKEVHVVNIDEEKTKAACSLLKYLTVTGDDDDLLQLGFDKFSSEIIGLFLSR